MKTITMALFLGLLTVLGFLGTSERAFAEDESAGSVLYYEMDMLHVQYEDERCGFKTVAIRYQIEYKDASKGTFITAYKPRIEAMIFDSLSEYLAEKRKARPRPIKKLMLAAVKNALGQDIASDVLITELQVLEI
jgi:hypothetical protein